MICLRCGNEAAVIEQAPDSFFRRVHCLACGWLCWLKDYSATAAAEEQRTRELEAEGLTRSDAQGVVEAENRKAGRPAICVY